MNTETYDQIALNNDDIGDSLKFVKENEMVKVCSHNGNVFAVEAPLFVELEDHRYRAGLQGRYCNRRNQAGNRRDRRSCIRTAVRRDRR